MFWWAVRGELRRWRAAGQMVNLWWRDDDARAPSDKLDRLLALAGHPAIPLTLAVIPDGDLGELGRRLRCAAAISVVQHGVDHVNRRPPGAPAEFASGAGGAEIAAGLARGWRGIEDLPGAIKVFVPPWNADHPGLREALTAEHYLAWSAFGGEAEGGRPARLDADLDVLRWNPPVRFRGAAKLLSRFRRLCVQRRQRLEWSRPIGLLTHHLQHDERAWSFLEWFLGETRGSHAVAWRALPDLLAQA